MTQSSEHGISLCWICIIDSHLDTICDFWEETGRGGRKKMNRKIISHRVSLIAGIITKYSICLRWHYTISFLIDYYDWDNRYVNRLHKNLIEEINHFNLNWIPSTVVQTYIIRTILRCRNDLYKTQTWLWHNKLYTRTSINLVENISFGRAKFFLNFYLYL